MSSKEERQKAIAKYVAEYQKGNTEAAHQLWGECERLITYWANKLIKKIAESASADVEDLIQCGYPAMIEAAKTFNGSGTFANWLSFYYRREVAEATGHRTARQQKDPIFKALSLDAPNDSEDGDSFSLYDVISDPANEYQSADDNIYRSQLHTALDKALETLPKEHEQALRLKYYNGLDRVEIAKALKCDNSTARKIERKAITEIRKPKARKYIDPFIESHTPYYLKVSQSRFNSTGISATEAIVLIREDIATAKRKAQ